MIVMDDDNDWNCVDSDVVVVDDEDDEDDDAW